MIPFNKNEISYKKRGNSQIIFIPFSYCGNADSHVKVSCFILHNDLKYLKHINSFCEESEHCKLTDNLKKKLKDMPKYLRKEFKRQLLQ